MLGDMEEVQSGNIYFLICYHCLPNTDAEIHFHVFSLVLLQFIQSEQKEQRDFSVCWV